MYVIHKISVDIDAEFLTLIRSVGWGIELWQRIQNWNTTVAVWDATITIQVNYTAMYQVCSTLEQYYTCIVPGKREGIQHCQKLPYAQGSSMCTWWKASSQSEVNFHVVVMLMLLHWMIILRNWHTVHNLNNMKTEEYRYGAFIYLLIIWSKNNVRKCITIYYVSTWKYMKYLSTILRRSIRWVNIHDIHQ